MIQVWVEDSIGERLWVDHEDCKGFVDNIVCGINTKQPPSIETEGPLRPESTSTEEDPLPIPSRSKDNTDFIVYPRYFIVVSKLILSLLLFFKF